MVALGVYHYGYPSRRDIHREQHEAEVFEEPLSFEEARRKREENASLVRCARCGKMIVATATRCPECGVHFQGEAQDFTHPSVCESESSSTARWVVVVAVLTLLAMLIAGFGM